MKTFFDYLYYRISKFYEDWDEKDGHIPGSVVLAGSFGFIFLALCIFLLYFFDKKVNSNMIWVVLACCSVLSFTFSNKRKYDYLAEKYKNEKNSKRKGWLVFCFVVGSFILYAASMLICGYWVTIEI